MGKYHPTFLKRSILITLISVNIVRKYTKNGCEKSYRANTQFDAEGENIATSKLNNVHGIFIGNLISFRIHSQRNNFFLFFSSSHYLMFRYINVEYICICCLTACMVFLGGNGMSTILDKKKKK